MSLVWLQVGKVGEQDVDFKYLRPLSRFQEVRMCLDFSLSPKKPGGSQVLWVWCEAQGKHLTWLLPVRVKAWVRYCSLVP